MPPRRRRTHARRLRRPARLRPLPRPPHPRRRHHPVSVRARCSLKNNLFSRQAGLHPTCHIQLPQSFDLLCSRGREETNRLQVPAASMAVKKEELQQQQVHVHDHGHEGANDSGGRGELEKAKARKPVSRRALRKILSRLHVDTWTRQHDAKLLDLLQRRTAGHGGERRRRSVGDLTGEDWSAVRVDLNAATGSAFSVEELQRRVGEFRRELEAVGRIKNHPPFGYDPRRRVVVAEEDDWKRYTLEENPGAVMYEGRSEHLGRLRAIFAGDGRADAGVTSRESRPKRYLNKLLRSFGLRCKL
uniref:Uncharacterized protein n=1 Tax=Avena sativa TaxID=4498 RepID=A0ACD5WCP8_AVESA